MLAALLLAGIVAAPLGSVWEAQIVREPSPVGSSDNFAPYGNGGSVLQNAKVTPFTGAGGGMPRFLRRRFVAHGISL